MKRIYGTTKRQLYTYEDGLIDAGTLVYITFNHPEWYLVSVETGHAAPFFMEPYAKDAINSVTLTELHKLIFNIEEET